MKTKSYPVSSVPKWNRRTARVDRLQMTTKTHCLGLLHRSQMSSTPCPWRCWRRTSRRTASKTGPPPRVERIQPPESKQLQLHRSLDDGAPSKLTLPQGRKASSVQGWVSSVSQVFTTYSQKTWHPSTTKKSGTQDFLSIQPSGRSWTFTRCCLDLMLF